jgi:S1-C subfamily serine protease
VNSGVGFAIPANQIANFLPRMKEGGVNRRIYHGTITGLGVADQREKDAGVLVADVSRGTAASDRGFKEGDLILAVNGHKVFNRRRFQGILSTWPAESEVSVTVRRDDRTFDIKVPLEGLEERSITGEQIKPPPPAKGSTGATFEDDKPGKDGPVTVTFVAPLSPAEAGGLSQGDIVLRVDGVEVKNRKTILDHVQGKKPGEVVTFRVLREGGEQDLRVKLGRLTEAGE